MRNPFLFLLLCLLLALPAAARESIAVLDFMVGDRAIAIGPDFSAVGLGAGTRTDLLTGDLTNALVNSGKYDVVERQRVADVLKEVSGDLTGESAKRIGSLLKANYLVVGTIEWIEAKAVEKSIPYTSRVQRGYEGRFTVNLRLVETKKGVVVSARKHSELIQRMDTDTPGAFLEAMKEQVCASLVGDIVGGTFPVKVASVTGAEVVLNRGSEGGARAGAVGRVYREGSEIRDPDTKQVIAREEREVGQIEVTEVQATISRALVLTVTPGDNVRVGDLVRWVPQEAAPRKPLTPGSDEAPLQF